MRKKYPTRSLTEVPGWIKKTCERCGGEFWSVPAQVAFTKFCSTTCNDEPAEVRFWKSVTKDGPMHPTKPELGCCWNSKFTPSAPYPSMKIGGVQIRVARFSLELSIGRSLPDGMYALHSCDNTRCVNPTHIREGTTQDNVNEKMERGRHQDMRGEKCPTAKLTEAQVKCIRENPDGLTGVELCRDARRPESEHQPHQARPFVETHLDVDGSRTT